MIARAPAFTRAHDNLGLCYEALNQTEEAIPHYREAVRLNRIDAAPTGWPALNLGILLRTRGEMEEAETLFREALTYDRHFAPGYYQLGALLEERGEMKEAVKALRQATSADTTYPEPHYALSRIYRRQGQVAEADEALVHLRAAAQEPERSGRQAGAGAVSGSRRSWHTLRRSHLSSVSSHHVAEHRRRRRTPLPASPRCSRSPICSNAAISLGPAASSNRP